jgi:dTDP-glucose 4,6-dehydratase
VRTLVTGGCGFIGSHVVRALIQDGHTVTNLDRLTYASNPGNVADVANHHAYRFVQGDICDTALMRDLVAQNDLVLNFAAETHVDRSLLDPGVFVRTDVEGVVSILEAVRANPTVRLVHMSTDEVFGPLPPGVEAAEEMPFAPTSPYSASKAAAELQVRAYAETYGLPVTVLRCCNVYGPNQHIEKFIPLFVTRALAGQPLPLYGDGMQEREWLYIDDAVAAVRLVLGEPPAKAGVNALHIGSGMRLANRHVAAAICLLAGQPESLVQLVNDRPGHDRRYALDSSQLRGRGWMPRVPFEEGLARTARWYADNTATWGASESEEFARYFEAQYRSRLATS